MKTKQQDLRSQVCQLHGWNPSISEVSNCFWKRGMSQSAGKRIFIFVGMIYSELQGIKGTKQATDLNKSPQKGNRIEEINDFVDRVWQVLTRESKLPAHLSITHAATETTLQDEKPFSRKFYFVVIPIPRQHHLLFLHTVLLQNSVL